MRCQEPGVRKNALIAAPAAALSSAILHRHSFREASMTTSAGECLLRVIRRRFVKGTSILDTLVGARRIRRMAEHSCSRRQAGPPNQAMSALQT